MRTKSEVILEEIVFQYHPALAEPPERIRQCHPENWNIPRLVEESMAHVGGYDFVDEEGYDFNDFYLSDCKTTTVITYPKPHPRHVFEIGSVETKVGALRIVAFNPIHGGLDYFFVPKDGVLKHKTKCYGKSRLKERIQAAYNVAGNHYNKFEVYRVDTFENLATWTVPPLQLALDFGDCDDK